MWRNWWGLLNLQFISKSISWNWVSREVPRRKYSAPASLLLLLILFFPLSNLLSFLFHLSRAVPFSKLSYAYLFTLHCQHLLLLPFHLFLFPPLPFYPFLTFFHSSWFVFLYSVFSIAFTYRLSSFLPLSLVFFLYFLIVFTFSLSPPLSRSLGRCSPRSHPIFRSSFLLITFIFFSLCCRPPRRYCTSSPTPPFSLLFFSYPPPDLPPCPPTLCYYFQASTDLSGHQD